MKRGFTLIELLLVIAIIAILVVTVFVALNPVKRFQQARDARRQTDVESILTAIHLYISDNSGSYPTGMSAGMAETQLGSAGSGCATTSDGCNATPAACLNLATPLAPYLKTIPIDPSLSSSSTTTNYTVVANSNGIVTVRGCGTEIASDISTSR